MDFKGAPPYVKQTWVVSGIFFGIINGAFHLAYTASLIPALEKPDSPIKVDLDGASWLASCIGIANLSGILMSSLCMPWLGRKKTLIICSIPGLFSWIFIYLAQDYPLLLLGRFVSGISTGGVLTVGPIVIGEYTSPKYRGVYLNLKTALVCLGALLTHLLGTFLSWRNLALMGLSLQAVSLAIIVTWPESPRWLASKRRYAESEAVFQWLRGKDEQSSMEYKEIVKLQEERSTEQKQDSSLKYIKRFFYKFKKPDFLKPFIIMFFAYILLEASGRHFFLPFALQIVEGITGKINEDFVYTLIFDLTITLSSLSASILIRFFKRRPLLFITGYCAIAVQFAGCAHMYLSSIGVISAKLSWMAIVLFLIYFVLVNLGCNCIPLVLSGEIFPLEHRAVGVAASNFIMCIFMWVVAKAVPYMLAGYHVYGTLAIFGVIQVICLSWLYFILPETKDKTLEEIEKYFYGRRSRVKEIGSELETLNTNKGDM